MQQAVDLALQHSRKVKASGADERVMTSMRREAASGFFPQASANGYLVKPARPPDRVLTAALMLGDRAAACQAVKGVQS